MATLDAASTIKFCALFHVWAAVWGKEAVGSPDRADLVPQTDQLQLARADNSKKGPVFDWTVACANRGRWNTKKNKSRKSRDLGLALAQFSSRGLAPDRM